MREVVVRSLTSGDWLNRDCLVTEVMQQGDYVTKVTPRCSPGSRFLYSLAGLRNTKRWLSPSWNRRRRSRTNLCRLKRGTVAPGRNP